MEINKLGVIEDAVGRIDAGQFANVVELCVLMNSLHGKMAMGRGQKLIEEVDEFYDELVNLDFAVEMNKPVAETRKLAFKMLWELSDLTANYWQVVYCVSKASGMSLKDFCNLLIGMAVRKQNERSDDPSWEPEML